MLDSVYKPSEWGTIFHNLPHEEALGAGSAGPGKTSVLLADPFPQIAIEHQRCTDPEHPYPLEMGESVGWAIHLRRTLKQLEQSIARTHRMFPKIDPNVRWDVQTFKWTFSSGYKYQFGHCKDKLDWENYFSSEYTHIGFDELVQFEEEQYRQIITRLRTDDPVLSLMLKARAMSNPVMRREAVDSFAVTDPFWVRRYFVDPAPDGNVTLSRTLELPDGRVEKTRRIYVPARITANPNKKFVDQYMKTLASAPMHIRAALLDGNWYYTEGSFYGEYWRPAIHTCVPFKFPADWPVFRSMDWGFKRHGCIHWWTIDEDDNLYCVREYSFLGKTDLEVAKGVRQIEEKMGLWRGSRSTISGPADTQLWEQRGESGESKARAFLKKGVHWCKADKKSRQRNAERLVARLKDHRDGTTTAGIVIFRTCENLIRTLPQIMTDPNFPEIPLDGGEDHWHDSLLYASAFASHGRRGIARHRAKQPWEEDDRKKKVGSGSRGRYGYGSSVA